MARILTEEGSYRQRSLGRALVGDKAALPYKIAVLRAAEWFLTGTIKAEALHPKHACRVSSISICPIGEIYTVGHALADYLDWSKLARSEGGHYNNLVLINYHLVPALSSIPIDDFTGKDLQRLAIKVIETSPKHGFGPVPTTTDPRVLSADEMRRRKRTFNSLVTILRMAFRYAWENGHLASERAWRSLNRVGVVHRPRAVFLSRDECRRLVDACDPALRKLVLAGLYTGCRVGELADLRVEDVAREGFGISIGPVKRSRPRLVYLSDEGMAFFLDQCVGKGDRDHVFLSSTGRPWKKHHSARFRTAVARAGLPASFVFHGLRHTYASDLLRRGASIDTVARQLGHSDTRTVISTYGHLAARDQERQVRECFAPLDPVEQSRAAERKTKLSALRQAFGTDGRLEEWNQELTSTLPRVSHARPCIEVMQAFRVDRSP